jgi:hypothetical protein
VGREKPCPGCKKPFFIPYPVAVPVEQQQDDTSEACGDVAWSFRETVDAMDDNVVRSATVPAADERCGLRPVFVFQATVSKCSVMREVQITFPKKVFSIRDDLLPARIRVDGEEPQGMPIGVNAFDETGKACFFNEQTKKNVLLNRLQEATHLLVELHLMKHGQQMFEFNVQGFGEIHRRLIAGAVGASMDQLQGFNQDLVDEVFRRGPQNIEALIELLCGKKFLRNDQVDEARRKELALFAAVQAFGEKYRVAEIFGYVEGGKVNDPLSMAVYNNLPNATRHRVGDLTICE